MIDKAVLVAEDYADTRAMIKMLLEMKHCRVLEAANGQEVVEIVAQNCSSIGLILMDLRMPVLNGIEATRRIHEQSETCSIPIVAISAHCEGDWETEARDAGAVECVRKPVDFKMLDEVLSRFLYMS